MPEPASVIRYRSYNCVRENAPIDPSGVYLGNTIVTHRKHIVLDPIEQYHPFIQRVVSGTTGERPLIGVSPGSGHISTTAARAGADIFFVFSAGLYRTAGVGSLASFLPYGNANDQSIELLRRSVLPHAGGVPVVAGLMPNDPERATAERLAQLAEIGIEAITNWPATGLVDGSMREIMRAEGFTAEAELAMLREARAAGFAVFGFALSPEEVRGFCESGVDGLILNVGLTRAVESAQEKKNQIRAAIQTVGAMWEVAKRFSPIPLSFLFGGSITQPIDLEEILREVPIHGYAGGSAFERIPVAAIVDSTIRRLKSVPRPPAAGTTPSAIGPDTIVGESRPIRAVRNLIQRTAPHDVDVCITGETGTGKELVARALHAGSARREMPFVTMNCGAIPDTLVESEFFGYEKGAFTGAGERRRGKFELANHGVLFLDEVGDLSPHGQVALLRVIQQGEILRIGGQTPVRVDVRILTATNRDLERAVADGSFRSDLYYRVSAMVIRTPPLREIPTDIPPLVRHLLKLLSGRLSRRLIGVTDEFMRRLVDYPWPGNVRELEHVLTRAALLEEGAVLEGRSVHLSRAVHGTAVPAPPSADTARLSDHLHDVVERYGGNKSRAARELGISRKTLYSWLNKG